MGRTPLTEQTPSFENGYTIPDGWQLSKANLKNLFGDIHAKLTALQALGANVETVIDELSTQGLQMISENLGPQIAATQDTLATLNTDILAAQAQIDQLIAGGVPGNKVTLTSISGVTATNAQAAVAELHAAINANTTAIGNVVSEDTVILYALAFG